MKALVLFFVLHAEPLPNGAAVTAVIETGGITVTAPARLIPCARGKRCAQLQNGRRVQGRLDGELFYVEDAP
jgi:hypothetical protein